MAGSRPALRCWRVPFLLLIAVGALIVAQPRPSTVSTVDNVPGYGNEFGQPLLTLGERQVAHVPPIEPEDVEHGKVNVPLPSHQTPKINPSLIVYRNDLAVEDDFGTRQLGTDVPP